MNCKASKEDKYFLRYSSYFRKDAFAVKVQKPKSVIWKIQIGFQLNEINTS